MLLQLQIRPHLQLKEQWERESYSEDGENDINLDDLDLELEENLKDLDMLDDLDDLDPSDYEKIGSSEYNDELEAQIAKELGEDL